MHCVVAASVAHLAVFGVNAHLLVEGVVPHMLHVIPIPHYSILHGVVDLQHGPQLTRLVTHHQVFDLNVPHFLSRPDDWPTHKRWKYVRWEVASSIPNLYKLDGLTGERRVVSTAIREQQYGSLIISCHV